MSESKDPNIAALLRELEGYELYGRKDRADQVRADLKRRGYVDKAEQPKKRASREGQQSTADSSKSHA